MFPRPHALPTPLQIHWIGVIMCSSPQQAEVWYKSINSYNKSGAGRTHAHQTGDVKALSKLILTIYVITRWNSILAMLERAYAMQGVSLFACS
jgi:hypothetical protein